jgi:FkbM family methyltransferase
MEDESFMDSFNEEFAKIEKEIPLPNIAKTIDAMKSDGGRHPIILFGAGQMAGVAHKYCLNGGLTITCICDSYKTGIHHDTDLPVISPVELLEKYKDALVMIATWQYEREITGELMQSGFSEKQIYPLPSLTRRIPIDEFKKKYFEGYAWIYRFLDDERSRQLVIDRARLYATGKVLEPNTQCDCYYEDGYILLGKNEIFLDGGAFIGDSAEAFIARSEAYSHIYAFEPDALNYEQARRRLIKYPDVDVIHKGLFGTETELTFFHNTTMSAGSSFMYGAISNEAQTLPVTAIDVFFAGRSDGELPTFIKMDIEGAEKEALLGAADVIKRVKPKLAVCVYHKPEDIYELPQTIMNMRDDYRFALRQHEYSCFETVLYAV